MARPLRLEFPGALHHLTYKADGEKVKAVMRPSATFNAALAAARG
jgi:monomeric isocitrate dehydrogenase